MIFQYLWNIHLKVYYFEVLITAKLNFRQYPAMHTNRVIPLHHYTI